MRSELELPRFWPVMLALSLLASIAVAPSAAAQANSQPQTQPTCSNPTTSTNQGTETAAASTVSKAANSISNLGSIFGKKKTTQNADKVANVAGGCDAKVNAAATDVGTVAGTATAAGSPANSSSSAPAANINSAAPDAKSGSISATQPANSSIPAQPQSASAPFVPPSGAPAAFVGPLDPSKLPDISGLHLGMTLVDAKAALQKLYPNARIDALNGMGLGPHNLLAVSIFRVAGDNTGHNQASVEFTAPPNAQVVWHMARNTPQPHVAHNNLVAALRQKYGMEAFAMGGDGALTKDDRAIDQMWWEFDEQGQLVSGAKLINGSPFDCGKGIFMNMTTGTPSNFYPSLMTKDTGGLSTFCASSYVGVVATISNQQIIDGITLDIVDLAVAVRSAKATDAWSKAEFDKAHQQDIQKSNQVKPSL